MKSFRNTFVVCLSIALFAVSCSKSGELDEEVNKLALKEFTSLFSPSHKGYVVKESHGQNGFAGDTWSLVYFKDVLITVNRGDLSDIDKLNGIVWRGNVVFDAKLMREFKGINRLYSP